MDPKRKKRLIIKGDGHCLPRAVFTGMKRKNLLPTYMSYKQIFREAIQEIKCTDKYLGYITNPDTYVVQLDHYENEKIYNSDIVDIVIAAPTEVFSVQ